jgi:RHS repeat-associated protein
MGCLSLSTIEKYSEPEFSFIENQNDHEKLAVKFYPFGLTMTSSSSTSPDVDKYKYQGKERDQETGYDYFEARFYDPALGRFMQVDPKAELGNWINSYAGMANNPMLLVDRDGQWPEKIHRMLVEVAFRGMSNQERSLLSNMQWVADRPNFQKAKFSFMHAMKDGDSDQSVSEAKGKLNNFINENIEIYNDKSSNRAKQLVALGFAVHAITDATSPAHEGFLKWNSSDWLPYVVGYITGNDGDGAIGHHHTESSISEEKLKLTVKLMEYLKEAFNKDEKFDFDKFMKESKEKISKEEEKKKKKQKEEEQKKKKEEKENSGWYDKYSPRNQ